MNTSQRSTRLVLGLMGIATAIVIVAGLAQPQYLPVALAAGIGYLLLAGLTLLRGRLSALRQPLESITAMQVTSRMSAAARRAAQRARNRGETSLDTTLLDIGLVLNRKRGDGRWVPARLAESVSMDDGAIQPYTRLYLQPGSAERLALIEFHVYDQSGTKLFSHQMKQFVRDGENLIPCERMLTLRDNEAIQRAGTWDLHISVDGTLVGAHSFSVAKPMEERMQRLQEEEEAIDEDRPVSLEDLLRTQDRGSRN